MNIGFDARPVNQIHTGIGSSLFNLLVNLAKNLTDKERITLFSQSPMPDSLSQLDNVIINKKYPILNYKQIWSNLFLPPFLEKAKIDIFHGSSNIDLPFKSNVKKVITIHDLIPMLFPKSVSLFFNCSFNYFIKKTIYASDHIITVSDSTANDLQKYLKVPSSKISVIKWGISNTFKVIGSDDKQAQFESVSRSYDFPFNNNLKYYLIVGQLAPHKNLQFLLNAIDKAKLKDAFFLIIGTPGRSQSQLISLLNKYNLTNQSKIIQFVQDRDLYIFYNLAHALLFPSSYEGFGLPPLEAAACGCPVIASNIPTSLELYKDYATLVNIDIDSWSQALSEHHKSTPVISTQIKQSQRVRNQYNWENTANLTLNLYRNLI